MARGCGRANGVPGAGPHRPDPPPRRLLRVVARFAEPLPVRRGRGTVLACGDDVVDVPDGGIAPGCAAGLVAQQDEAPQRTREPATRRGTVGVGRDRFGAAAEGVASSCDAREIGAVTGGEHSAQAQVGPLRVRARDQVARRLRRQDVPGQQGRLVARGVGFLPRQGVCRHDQLDLEGDRGSRRLSGDPFDEGVGHHLTATTVVTLGLRRSGSPLQGGEDRDALGNGQQGGEVGHRVGRRTKAHATLAVGSGRPLRHRRSVEPAGQRLRSRLDLTVSQRGEVGGQRGIDGGPVLTAEAGGLSTDDRRPPLTHRAGLEVGHGAGHLVDHRLGKAEMA